MSDGVDPGAAGFLSIFGPATDTADPSPVDSTESSYDASSAEAPPAAEPSSPEDLSADEVVAARFVASLEADGIEIPEEEEAEAAPLPTGELDLSSLTPEQLRTLANEAISLRARVTQADQNAVAQKVHEVSQQAILGVQ